jgi:hypothetical protein
VKTLMRSIQLAVSALEAERTGRPIAEHHLAEIAAARQELSLTKGVDVVAALHGLIHAGKSVLVPLETVVYTSGTKRSESGRAHFAQRG